MPKAISKVDDFLTVKSAAELLGVAPNTIRNWDKDGKIPVYRHPISKYRLFKKSDLEVLLRRIEESGAYPTGWGRRQKRRRTPK
jgi:DNA (cytosine-5)-methyltransferase 1